jgi:surface carbohydrate biosynthesis protein
VLKHFLLNFLKSKKIFSFPKKKEILIFDGVNKHLIIPFFKSEPEVLYLRGESINIPILLLSLFRKGKKSEAYKDEYIKKVNPKLIITFIDNNFSFHSVSLRHHSVKTMFIQNGIRGYHGQLFEQLDLHPKKEKLFVDCMMTLGHASGTEYSKYIKGKVFPIGSIKNNEAVIYKEKIKDSLVFISQWQDHGVQINSKVFSHSEFFAAEEIVLRVLNSFSKENKKKLFVIPRNRQSSVDYINEKNYFKKHLDHFEFLEPSCDYPSYRAVDLAEVSVFIDSTLGYESLARGNKAAAFTIRGTLMNLTGETFGWPLPLDSIGPYWSSSSDEKTMTKILHHLFELDEESWSAELSSTNFNKIVAYDEDNKILKKVIEDLLK